MRAAASCKNQMKTWLSLVALTVVFCYLFLHESVLLFWTNVVKRNIEVSSIVDRISIIMTCQSCPITGKHIVECKVVVLCSRFNNESGNLANLTLAFLAKLFHFKDKKKCKKSISKMSSAISMNSTDAATKHKTGEMGGSIRSMRSFTTILKQVLLTE